MRALLPLLALALGACGRSEPVRVTKPARHVLLVVVDTLRADRVGAFGGAPDVTHGMDQLARRGVRFERASAQSSWTSPSMVSLFTGRYLAERRMSLPEEIPSLAERFRAAGFGTAAFVANPLVGEQNGFARGFDQFTILHRPQGDERIGDWIRSRAGRPTFTFVHLSEPHDPYTPPQRLVKRARVPIDADMQESFAREAARRGIEHDPECVAAVEEQLALYEAEVRWSDHALSEVLAALAQAGELEDACVALTADHGEGLWTRPDLEPFVQLRLEHGEALDLRAVFQQRHGGQLHEELIRVPLVLVAPELPRGRVVDVLVENVDLLPTLLELAGIAPPGGIDGRSLLTAVRAPESWPKRESFSMTRYVRCLTTAEGMKLHLPTEFGLSQADLAVQLYDLKRDPRERVNLASEQPELVRALSARLERIAARGLGATNPAAQAEVMRNLEALQQLGYVGAQGELQAPIGAELPDSDEERR